MIERKIIAQKFKEFQVQQYVKNNLGKVGLSNIKLKKTSMGEKVIVSASRPGLVVGRGGATIQKLTRDLKATFKLENPQIEIDEVKDFGLDAAVVAESIVAQLERFGTQRFKGIGHKSLETVMRAGALGVEILISGKIPSSRAKTWRFVDGYMKKCGDIAITGVDTSKQFACLKTGVVGVQVRIMPATTILPDKIVLKKDVDVNAPIVEEVKETKKAAKPKKKSTTKKAKSSKSTTKKESKKETPKEEVSKDEKKVDEKAPVKEAEAKVDEKADVEDKKE
jgi:small subunit ribosomal protein S3